MIEYGDVKQMEQLRDRTVDGVKSILTAHIRKLKIRKIFKHNPPIYPYYNSHNKDTELDL
jgi:hypothetical protein